MLAVIFEERRQRHLNKVHEEELENRVLERTRQLEHEIQERARAQDALKISEERLRLALEATQDGIWDLNLQSGHLFWSGRCFTMLGYAPGEFPMSLQRWREILHPEDQELVWPRLQDLLQGQVDPFEIEYRCRSKDETFRLIMCRGKPMQWAADDRVVRVVGTHVDITDWQGDRHRPGGRPWHR